MNLGPANRNRESRVLSEKKSVAGPPEGGAVFRIARFGLLDSPCYGLAALRNAQSAVRHLRRSFFLKGSPCPPAVAERVPRMEEAQLITGIALLLNLRSGGYIFETLLTLMSSHMKLLMQG